MIDEINYSHLDHDTSSRQVVETMRTLYLAGIVDFKDEQYNIRGTNFSFWVHDNGLIFNQLSADDMDRRSIRIEDALTKCSAEIVFKLSFYLDLFTGEY